MNPTSRFFLLIFAIWNVLVSIGILQDPHQYTPAHFEDAYHVPAETFIGVNVLMLIALGMAWHTRRSNWFTIAFSLYGLYYAASITALWSGGSLLAVGFSTALFLVGIWSLHVWNS